MIILLTLDLILSILYYLVLIWYTGCAFTGILIIVIINHCQMAPVQFHLLWIYIAK